MSKKKEIKIPYESTEISPERTKAEIEKLLKDHSIQDIQWTSFRGENTLKFLWKVILSGMEKEILFEFKPPYIPAKRRTWNREKGTYEVITVNLEAQSYRLLWHYLKNKLDAVQWGLVTMEKEFLSQAVIALPDGTSTTVGDKINQIYETVKQPALIQRYNAPNDRMIDVTP